MAPVTQYVFAETLELPEHFTAGSHKWLPYSAIPPFPKQINKHQFDDQLTKADNLNCCLQHWRGSALGFPPGGSCRPNRHFGTDSGD